MTTTTCRRRRQWADTEYISKQVSASIINSYFWSLVWNILRISLHLLSNIEHEDNISDSTNLTQLVAMF